MNDQDIAFLKLSLDEAESAGKRGEVPVGAVLVSATGEVLSRAGNRTIELHDPTAHAEMQVMRAASAALANERLTGTTLYVTLEPCAMCACAISLARVARLVYAASDPKGGAVEHGPKFFNLPTCHHRAIVECGSLAAESARLLREFFRSRRLPPAIVPVMFSSATFPEKSMPDSIGRLSDDASDVEDSEDFLSSGENGASSSGDVSARLDQAEALLQDRRVQAFLGALADGESNGRYNALVGGGTFQDYSRHPQVYVRKYDSTSAGAYQFNYPTWQERAGLLGLDDFSPHSQDLAAVDTLNDLGAIPKLFSDDLDGAIFATAKKWESLPIDSQGKSSKGNPRSLDKFKNDYYSRLY